LGARAGKVKTLATGNRLDDALGESNRVLIQEVVRCSLRKLGRDGFGDRGMRVTEEIRSRAKVIVDIVAAGHVGHVASLTLGHDQIDLVREVEHAKAATRQDPPRRVQQIALSIDSGKRGETHLAPPHSRDCASTLDEASSILRHDGIKSRAKRRFHSTPWSGPRTLALVHETVPLIHVSFTPRMALYVA